MPTAKAVPDSLAATATAAERRASGPLSSLRHRDFALFWTAALISNSGTWMQSITVPYVLYDMTGSKTWLGVSAVASFGPGLLMGPIAGTLADRFPRKRIILVTQSISMMTAFALWALWISDQATPHRLVGLVTVSGLASGVNISAWQSFVPLLVPRESLMSAVRLNSMQFNAARAFGPAAAGLVLRWRGPAGTFFGNAVSFLVVLAALMAVRPSQQIVAGAKGRFRDEFRDGVRFLRGKPGLQHPIITVAIMGFFGSSIVQLAAAFSRDEFGQKESGFGFLVAMFGIGGIVGSIAILTVAERVTRSQTSLAGIFVYIVGVETLGWGPHYVFGLAALFLMGGAWVLMAVSLNTAIQSQVSDDYRGRVISLYLMTLMAATPLGALLGGRLGDAVGLRPTIIGSGCVLVTYAIVAVVRMDRLRAIDHETVAPGAPGPPLGSSPQAPGSTASGSTASGSTASGSAAPGSTAPASTAPAP
jgi:predicted MFS family arabinose efflux permease